MLECEVLETCFRFVRKPFVRLSDTRSVGSTKPQGLFNICFSFRVSGQVFELVPSWVQYMANGSHTTWVHMWKNPCRQGKLLLFISADSAENVFQRQLEPECKKWKAPCLRHKRWVIGTCPDTWAPGQSQDIQPIIKLALFAS